MRKALRRSRCYALALMGAAGVAGTAAAAPVPGTSPEEVAALGEAHAAEHARQAATATQAPRTQNEVVAAVAGPPAQVGQWAAPFPIPVMAIHAALLPTGKVLWFSYPTNPSPRHNPGGYQAAANESQAWLWDPATGATKRVDPPIDPATGRPANIWCGGQNHQSDGTVLVTGGNLAYSTPGTDFKGLDHVYTFNPFSERWVTHPRMRHGRWYPTQVLLGDGRSVIMGGLDESGNGFASARNLDIELFTPGSTPDAAGRISLLGTRSLSGSAPGAPPNGGLYPHMFLMPSGRVLTSGPFAQDTWMLTSPGSSTAWQDVPNTAYTRLWGTAVPVPEGPQGSSRVMHAGGSAPPSVTSTTTDIAKPTVEVYDEDSPAAGWQATPSMNVGRGHHNTVLLPDGSMVAVGGGVGIRNGDQWAADPEQRQVELWDPATGQWRLGPSQAEARAYHSTALLLPDGRVVSAGDDANGGIDRDTAEVYSPPYLFKGPRPAIRWAPSEVRHGAPFSVGTSDRDVVRASLVAPGATTHAVDMSQRVIPLSVAQRADGQGVDLTAPASVNAAPPGYYMVFLLNDKGVPSVASWVKLSPTAPDAPPIPSPTPPPAPASPPPAPVAPNLPPAAPAPRPGEPLLRTTHLVPIPPGITGGRTIGRLVGGFDGGRLAPWRARGAVSLLPSAARSSVVMSMRAGNGRPAAAWRGVGRLLSAKTRLTFQLFGGRITSTRRAGSTVEVRISRGPARWREVSVQLPATSRSRVLRLHVTPRAGVQVDDLRLS